MNVLAKAFEAVASGQNSKYWVGLVLGFKGIAPGNLQGETGKGYRIGLRLRAIGLN